MFWTVVVILFWIEEIIKKKFTCNRKQKKTIICGTKMGNKICVFTEPEQKQEKKGFEVMFSCKSFDQVNTTQFSITFYSDYPAIRGSGYRIVGMFE